MAVIHTSSIRFIGIAGRIRRLLAGPRLIRRTRRPVADAPDSRFRDETRNAMTAGFTRGLTGR